jgi:MFS family permease
MDEAVINGANLFYPDQLNIPQMNNPNASRNQWLLGLISSSPYVRTCYLPTGLFIENVIDPQLCCAVLGCWLTEPMNRYFGRRGTIFISAFFSWATCFWSAATNSWPHLFVARFFLGIGIGPKSATVPVYAAECAPPAIRGALVMMWQTWTAFGIMLGYVMDLVRGIPRAVLASC